MVAVAQPIIKSVMGWWFYQA